MQKVSGKSKQTCRQNLGTFNNACSMFAVLVI